VLDSGQDSTLFISADRTNSNAMKWFQRIAQGFSPGKGPHHKFALKGRPSITREPPFRFWRPYRADLHGIPYPGLKPWAILLNHFGVSKLLLISHKTRNHRREAQVKTW
jgi:hypothetical protein